MRLMVTVVMASILLASVPVSAQLEELLKRLPQQMPPGGGLSDVKIGAALREALQVGATNAVSLTGRRDGYYLNQAIKILMPERLRTLERGLRAVGYGDEVDEFVLGMNRAAERSAPFAKQIFWNAIEEMTIGDVRKVYGGGETAATEYFREKTTDRLTVAFRPVVETAMNEVGVTRQYKELLGRAQVVPFLKLESFDIDRYVVAKALDGLFHVVGDEERKIRTNPSARVTGLLQEVFGQR